MSNLIISGDPKSIVVALVKITKEICEQTGADPAEAVMLHLTAAAYIAGLNKSADDLKLILPGPLDDAIDVADGWFGLDYGKAKH